MARNLECPFLRITPEAIVLPDSEFPEEQRFVDRLYRRLDELRAETEYLRAGYSRYNDNTPGGRVQADIAYAHHTATLTALTVAEDRLCFGKLDHLDGSGLHIGRMGIFDAGGDGEQLLMDWRAPSARPFYVATAAEPLGVARRRHLRIRRRRVEGVSEEYLDVRPETLRRLGVSAADVAGQQGPAGESALLEAITAPRTGRMADIVATIQSEQDAVIRADRSGVLVVQGGPGTGKTAVALHRTAYLLYTYREQLGSRGVLIVGPNRTFLRYISQVLPSLGENAVVLTTLGDLLPGIHATALDEPETAILKGRPAMATVIGNALLDRQRVPREPVTVHTEQGALLVEPAVLRLAQERAWGSRLPHNRARAVFVRTLVTALTRQVAARHTEGLGAAVPFTADDAVEVSASLRADEKLTAAVQSWWPVLSAERLVADLLSTPRRLRTAAPGLTDRQRDLLHRPSGAPWTVADIPLLDEAAELLGPIPTGLPIADDESDSRREYAEEVLDMLASEHPDAEAVGTGIRIGGPLSAEDLADLRERDVELTSTAERAASDREWTYGHVVVDEAQELSPMAWRALLRRCPARSMTVVGDIAQTGDPAGARSWSGVLRPHLKENWRLAELTVNYRTPAEISAVADRVLHRIDPALQPPVSVRTTGVQPWWRAVAAADRTAGIVAAVRAELAADAEEHLAVLVPAALQAEVRAAIRNELPELIAVDGDPDSELLSRVVVLTVGQAKGLEFDVVILVEPDLIESAGPRGLGDVYVALTRATQRLGVIHSGERPRIAG